MRHTFRLDLHPMQEGTRSLGKTASPPNVVESTVCRDLSILQRHPLAHARHFFVHSALLMAQSTSKWHVHMSHMSLGSAACVCLWQMQNKWHLAYAGDDLCTRALQAVWRHPESLRQGRLYHASLDVPLLLWAQPLPCALPRNHP